MKQTLEAGAVMWVKKHVIPLHANYRNMRPVTQREINCLLYGIIKQWHFKMAKKKTTRDLDVRVFKRY